MGDGISRRDLLVGGSALGALGLAASLPGCDPTAVGYVVGKSMAIQTIQDFDGTIPLIAGKRTILRVFPATVTRPGEGISGTATVLLPDGTVLDTLDPLNGPVASRTLDAIDSDQPGQSLDFELPLADTARGDVVVRFDLTNGGSPPARATLRKTLHFRTIGHPEAALAPVLVEATAYGAPAPSLADFQAALDGALKRLPLPEDHFAIKPPTGWSTNRAMSSGDDFMWICTDMALHFFNIFGSDFPVGVVPPPATAPSGFYTDGMYNSAFAGAVLVFSATSFVSQDETEGTFGHEFTHHYGLGHAAGCGTPDGIDSSLPMSTDLTGMDASNRRILPRGTSELMTYCGFPRWPSSTTYLRILGNVS